jgi:hypothetical protein
MVRDDVDLTPARELAQRATRNVTRDGAAKRGHAPQPWCVLYAGGSLSFRRHFGRSAGEFTRNVPWGNGLVIGGTGQAPGLSRVPGSGRDDHQSKLPGWAISEGEMLLRI